MLLLISAVTEMTFSELLPDVPILRGSWGDCGGARDADQVDVKVDRQLVAQPPALAAALEEAKHRAAARGGRRVGGGRGRLRRAHGCRSRGEVGKRGGRAP